MPHNGWFRGAGALAIVVASGLLHSSVGMAQDLVNVSVPAGLELQDVAPAESDDFDFRNWLESIRGHIGQCELSGGVSVKAVALAPGTQDWTLRLSQEGDPLGQIQVLPLSGVVADGWSSSPGPGVACDSESDRVFFGHPVLGYVAAYRVDGTLLWRHYLPDFEVPNWLDRNEGGVDGQEVVIDAQTVGSDLSSSSMGRISFVDGYLLVEYRGSPDHAFYHAVLHRSGQLVGTVGPWAGFLRGAVDRGGWAMHLGKGGARGYQSPEATFRLVVRDKYLENLVRHVVAWLMPRDDDSGYTYRNCDAIPLDTIEPYLGETFSRELAGRAREVLREMGGANWFLDFIQGTEVSHMIGRYRMGSDSWKTEFESALWVAGIDVEVWRHLSSTAK